MIQFGNDKIKEIYVGSDKIKEVYHGSDLVWKSDAGLPFSHWVRITQAFMDFIESETGLPYAYWVNDVNQEGIVAVDDYVELQTYLNMTIMSNTLLLGEGFVREVKIAPGIDIQTDLGDGMYDDTVEFYDLTDYYVVGKEDLFIINHGQSFRGMILPESKSSFGEMFQTIVTTYVQDGVTVTHPNGRSSSALIYDATGGFSNKIITYKVPNADISYYTDLYSGAVAEGYSMTIIGY